MIFEKFKRAKKKRLFFGVKWTFFSQIWDLLNLIVGYERALRDVSNPSILVLTGNSVSSISDETFEKIFPFKKIAKIGVFSPFEGLNEGIEN